MKTSKFNLKTFLGENRDQVISQFENLKTEKFYNGVSLKQFMVEVFQQMDRNNPKSEKKALSLLPFVMGDVYFNNSNVNAVDYRTEALRKKYEGTAYMALV